MTRTILPLFAAAVLLTACNQQDHTIVQKSPGDEAPAPPKLDPSQLPPSIMASKTYRCKDNSIVYIDWMSDKTARVKTKANDVGTPPAEGELKGTQADSTVTYKGKACKA